MEFGQLLREDLSSHSKASNLAFNEKVKGLQAAGQTVYHFAFGQSPFSVPEPFVRQLQAVAGDHDYLNVAGLKSLRQAITEFHREWDQVELEREQIIVGPGSKELIYLTFTVFKGQIWLPAPAWTTYGPQAELAGHAPRTLLQHAEQGWKLQPETLESQVRTVPGPHLLVLTNPGNPSGCSYTRSELERLGEVCRKYKVVVLSDEIYARLQYEGTHVCMSKVYPEGTILTTGFSKWSSAGGWRLGYAHYPASLKQLHQAVLSAASHTYSCAPANIQHAVARALAQDSLALREYIVSCRSILSAVAKYCHSKLSAVGVKGNIGRAGYYFMPDFANVRDNLARKGATSGQQMCDLMLKEAKVALMPSSSFLLGEDALTVRFCYVNFDGDRCIEYVRGKGGCDVYTPDVKMVEELCPDLVSGINSLCQWVNGLKKM